MNELELWTADLFHEGSPGSSNDALLTNGTIILDIGSLHDLQHSYPNAKPIWKGAYLGVPLVNSHTHLDLGYAKTFRGPFDEFIRYVISLSGQRGLDAAASAFGKVPQSIVGDIASRPEVVDWWLLETRGSGVVYWEVLGLLPPEKENELLQLTRSRLERWKSMEKSGGPQIGLSPHAPYSLSPSLMIGLVELAHDMGLPLQIHAAESPAEHDFFVRRTGPLYDLFKSQGWPVDMHPKGLSPVAYLADIGALGEQVTLVHGVQVNEEDVRIISQFGSRLVSCPRSNEHLGAGLPPYDLYKKHNVNISLGTDSIASAPSLDVRDELKFLAKHGYDMAETVTWAAGNAYHNLSLPPVTFSPGDPISKLEIW